MELNKYLCNNTEWKTTKSGLFYKKMVWTPFAKVNKIDFIEIYLEPKNAKLIVKLLKNIKKSKFNLKFHFISPLLSDPHFLRTINDDGLNVARVNIENYLKNFAKEEFFDGFNSIDFNLVENLISYCRYTNSFNEVSEIYTKINEEVQYTYYDYYRKSQVHSVKRDDIRSSFNELWRDIQIQNLLE